MGMAAPVRPDERISSIDVLRGFALLGILLMNIVGFALYSASYDDPTVAGGATGINLWTWIVMHVLAEGKMRCLFSLVFGASLILLTSRIEAKGGPSTDVFLRRNLWLILFGMVHAYFLWYGDILYPYALCALVLLPFRHMRVRSLLIIGGVLIVLQAGANIYYAFDTKRTIETAQSAIAAEKAAQAANKKVVLTAEQEEAKKSWEEMQKHIHPTKEDLQKDANGWLGGFPSVFKTRAKLVGRWHSMPYYHPMNWDIWSMMILGMAFMKAGLFSASYSYRFYGWLAAIGYLIGISVNSTTAWLRIQSNFDVITRSYTGMGYDIGRLSIALAHMAVLLMLCKAGAMTWLTSRLAAVGQMAFSNYILQSVTCSTFFYGYGFGMYSKLERHQLYYLVAFIWILQLIVSPIWLKYFRFGPLEWGWRSLTYWKRQPMRISPAMEPAPEAAGGLTGA